VALACVMALAVVVVSGARATDVATRASVAWGRESDLTLSPGPTPTVVPGGPFAALNLATDTRWRRSGSLRLDLGGQGWLEQFTDAGGRRLVSVAVVADGQWRWSRRWSGRLAAGGAVLDDSARREARRLTGWLEAGVVRRAGPWRLEVDGGLEGRRYPGIGMDDEATYTETVAGLALRIERLLGRRARVRGAIRVNRTAAVGGWYDDRGVIGELGAEVWPTTRLAVLADGYVQQRTFVNRPAGEDDDRYLQAGVSVLWRVGGPWSARAAVARSRYRWPDGAEVDTERWQVAVIRAFGGGGAGLPPPGTLPRDDAPDVPRAGRPLMLRVRAPEAHAVALVGDFNGWEPAAAPMRRAGDGWWEATVTLAAGTWSYAFLVDGEWTLPPDAAVTEDDGFGGRNAVLVVLP
jgi:hypothetical protein